MIDVTKQTHDILHLLNNYALRAAANEFKGLIVIGFGWDDTAVYGRDLYLVNRATAIGTMEIMKQYIVNEAMHG